MSRGVSIPLLCVLALSGLIWPSSGISVPRVVEVRDEISDGPGEVFPDLPDIIATPFEVMVSKRSQSGRVYLFEDLEQDGPETGRIVFMRRGGESAMAFRVLRSYNNRTRFAASRVRRYTGVSRLNVTDPLLALKKDSDFFPPRTPEEIELDEADLEDIESDMDLTPDPEASEDESALLEDIEGELEEGDEVDESEFEEEEEEEVPVPEILAYDPELDRGSSPSDLTEKEEENQLVVEDWEPYDQDRQWASFQMGLLRNFDVEGASTYYTGAGFRYGLTTVRDLIIRRSQLQDSLSLDAGFFFYKILNFQGDASNDAYTLMPLVATARYNVQLHEGLGFFAYLGFVKNFVIAAFGDNTEEVANGVAQLSTLMPAAGIGAFFRFGPRWFLRADIGMDIIGTGVVLKF